MPRIEFSPEELGHKPFEAPSPEGNREVGEELRGIQVDIADSIWELFAADPDGIDITSLNMPQAMQEQFLLRLSEDQSTKDSE